MKLCYLDNGATTFPKPPAVWQETARCISEYCGNAGRGSHILADMAAEKIYEARCLARDLFSAPDEERVVLTCNATHALNAAIRGLVPRGSHVIISDLEHNSVLRCVAMLAREEGVEYSIFRTEGDVLSNIRSLIRKNTSAVICIHSSNVTNVTLPIERIGKMLYSEGILFIVDAAQSAGSRRIDVSSSKISALCAAGHKGLLGPQGTGLCIFSPEVSPKPLMYGGSGSESRLVSMPSPLPDRLEAGTLSAPLAAGLCEGIKYVMAEGEENICKRERAVVERIRRHYKGSRRIREYSRGEGSLWLFNVKGKSAQEIGRALSERGVCTRAGLHCAPLAHMTLGTPEDGAVRVSAGPFNTLRDADHFIASLDDILEKT